MTGGSWRERPLALIGLSGSGKSSVAPYLAQGLDSAVFDVDAAIVAASGLTAAEFFAQHGEAAFRRAESQQLALGLAQRQVVACGGGIVLAEENRALLRQTATVIWLDAEDGVILQRLTGTAEIRPNLLGDAAGRLAAQRAARTALYAATADLRVDSGSAAPAALAATIIRLLDQRRPTEISHGSN
jgi:shikimate kinase